MKQIKKFEGWNINFLLTVKFLCITQFYFLAKINLVAKVFLWYLNTCKKFIFIGLKFFCAVRKIYFLDLKFEKDFLCCRI